MKIDFENSGKICGEINPGDVFIFSGNVYIMTAKSKDDDNSMLAVNCADGKLRFLNDQTIVSPVDCKLIVE